MRSITTTDTPRVEVNPIPPAEDTLSLLERKRIADAVWLLSLVFLIPALAIPWGLGLVEVDFIGLSQNVIIFIGAFASLSWASGRLSGTATLQLAIAITQMIGVLFLAYVWAAAGGIDNPGYLLFFPLAVIASGLLGFNWQPYMIALLAIALVWAISVHQANGIQLFIEQLGWPKDWIETLQTLPLPIAHTPFIGSLPSPPFQVTLLIIFSVALVLVSAASTAIVGLITRLSARVRFFRDLTEEARNGIEAVLHAVSEPSVVVFADNYQLIYASDSFCKRLSMQPDEMAGKTLFDLIEFTNSAEVKARLSDGCGEIRRLRLHLSPGMPMANLRFYRIEHRNSDYIGISFHEVPLRDSLTRLYNREHFDYQLPRLLANASEAAPLTIALWDLDDFAEINDRFGPLVGNGCLLAFAHLIQGQLRGGELFWRLEEDTFAAAFPDQDLDTVRFRIHDILKKLQGNPIGLIGTEQIIKTSVGITTCHPGEGTETLIHRAEQALYDAKHKGGKGWYWVRE